MFRRTGFNDGFNPQHSYGPQRGPQHNYGQREILGAGYHQDSGARVTNAAKMLNYVQLNDRESWLLQLGLSRHCAHELARESLERPDFNLQHLQNRWRRVYQVMGPHRQAETNAIVLREIRELLQQRPVYQGERPRTPSPPRDINWNNNWANVPPQPDCHASPMDHSGRYEFRGATSTPLFVRNRNLPDRQSTESDFYNIDNDPRNMEETYVREQRRAQSPHYTNENNDMGQFQVNDVYNINEDPRNFRMQQSNYTENRNNNESYMNNLEVSYTNQDFRNRADNYSRNFTGYNSNEKNEMGYHNMIQNYDCNMNYNEVRLNTNHDPFSRDDQQPRYLNNNQDEPRFLRNFTGDFNRSQARKRIAERIIEQEVQVQPKRRFVEPRETPMPFQIGGFEMPYINRGNNPLPQPEKKSYAIKFYKRKHTFLIGGIRGRAPNQLPVIITKSTTISRNSLKQFRRNLRVNWTVLDSSKKYNDWNLWWKDHKWCEKSIDKELERFRGVHVKNILLRFKLDYTRDRSIGTLMSMAKMAFDLNANNYQSIIATLFELMNLKFLANLTTEQMEILQNFIRRLPNYSWISKMRGMVYLWSCYSQVQSDNDPLSVSKTATERQWNSPLFHWLAKQAYAELKLISQIEWKDHQKMYPTISSSPTDVKLCK